MAKRNSSSRQERRRQARELEKQRRFDDTHEQWIIERQNKVDDRLVELYTTCIALAVYDEYGYMPARITRIVTAFCNRLMSLTKPENNYDTLSRELREKTGCEFVWSHDGPTMYAG